MNPERPELAVEELDHALRVLRLGPGDALVGLDGRGGRWPLRVVRAEGRRLEVEVEGPLTVEPAPGEEGAPLPWIEIALPLPRGRGEAVVDRLTQLGVAAVTPLETERAHEASRSGSQARAERLGRVARQACKQSGRAWVPVLNAPCAVEELSKGRPKATLVVASPRARGTLLEWVMARRAERWSAAAPLVVVIGPEGGLAEAEEEALIGAGAEAVGLGPHVLRIETSAEAAAAVIVQALMARDREGG
ncbi:MAG TPA: RsmE family RNA methyltransferase [Candidatus Limnocylindrales bacterium]|nr:RsmE family RNA methyltransferase [Candidatus Limnocylindrales bacterium]